MPDIRFTHLDHCSVLITDLAKARAIMAQISVYPDCGRSAKAVVASRSRSPSRIGPTSFHMISGIRASNVSGEARPKLIGQMAFLRPQFTTLPSVVITIDSPNSSASGS